MRLIRANQSTASRRRVYFHLVDATDGITPETGEAAGQPQISTNGGAWTNTGIGTLSAIGSGRYYADLTQAAVGTAGDVIETRYKSAATAECPGDSVQVVAFNPDDAVRMGMSSLPSEAPGANGGMPTVDADNRIAGVQGTITTLDALDTAQDAQHSQTQTDIGDLNNFDGTGATLHTDYDAAKTAAQAGNAMALTSGERTTLAAAIEAAIINEVDGNAVMQAIADLIADDMTTGDLTVQAIASAVRDAILDRVLSGNHDDAGSTGKVLQDILTDTGTTLPATLSGIDGKIDTVDGVADSILEDTGTTIPATLAGLSTFDPTADVVDVVTYEAAIKLLMAAVFGKTALPDGSTVQFKGRDGSTTVLTVTYSANAGERLTSVVA